MEKTNRKLVNFAESPFGDLYPRSPNERRNEIYGGSLFKVRGLSAYPKSPIGELKGT
jgi:hypothetical protein